MILPLCRAGAQEEGESQKEDGSEEEVNCLFR